MADNIQIIDGAGVQRTLRATEENGIKIPHHILEPIGAAFDMFGRLRVSDRGYRFDSQFTYQIDADLWDSRVFDGAATGDSSDGTISHDATNRKVVLTAKSGAVNRLCVLQSAYHAPYTPGAGQLVFVTGRLGAAPAANGEVGMGYYDGENGVYLRRDSTGIYVGIKTTTSASDDEVEQNDPWNYDRLDGSGPSGITLDLEKTQIFCVAMQALYVGAVVVGFDIGGKFVPVHVFSHANVITEPYIAQASLPVRYWSSANNTASDVVMDAVCSTVISEGGADLFMMPGREFVASGENADVDTAAEPILAIRCKQQINSINQNAITIPIGLAVDVTGSGVWIEVRRAATITAGSWTSVDASSTVETCNLASTTPLAATASTGVLIDEFPLPASATIRTSQQASMAGKAVISYSHLLASAGNIVVFARGGSNATVRASLKWKEIR